MSQRIINSSAQIFKDNTSAGDSLYFLDPDGHKLEIHVGHWRARIAVKKLIRAVGKMWSGSCETVSNNR